jgi:hydrocephalus-inducing protein
MIEVVCNADEVQRFTDTLHVIVNNGTDLEVALRAKGVGSTLYCKEDLRNIDFGTEYTHKNVPKQFFLENRGRKPMKIIWARQKKMEKKPKGAEEVKGDAKAATSKSPAKPTIVLPGQEESK